MRNSRLTLLIALFAMPALFAQIKIGDNPQAISPTSVLELESNDRVLVITRINTTQMNAIVPNQGAMVYNTDTQCIHYYDGTQWVNLCNSAGFEIAENSISSIHVIDFSITGDDIQGGSIGPGKLQNESVTQEKLGENSVGAYALDNANIGVTAFDNDAGYITAADLDIVSAAAGNVITDNGGAYYDDSLLLADITQNAVDIANDNDTNANNEIQTLSIAGNILTLTNPTGNNIITLPAGGTTEVVDQTTITGLGTAADPFTIEPGGNNQVLTTNATGVIQWQASAAGGSTEIADQTTITGVGTAGDPFTIEPGTADQVLRTTSDGLSVEWSALPTGGAVISDATLSGDGSSLANALSLADNAVNSAKIDNDAILLEDLNDNGAGDGQIIKWNNTSGLWEIADDDTGTATLTDGNIFVGGAGDTPTDVTLSGDATLDNLGELTIADDAVELGMLSHPASPVDGDVMVWDNTALEWVIEAQAGEHSGTPMSLFFADTNPTNLGKPTTAFNPNGGGTISTRPSLIWDQSKRTGSGALGIGIDGGPFSTVSKVHISEDLPNGLAFPLQIQNRIVSSAGDRGVGILFSTERQFEYGKGALVYERTAGFARGDFHFLQDDNDTTTDYPDLANDKAFTIKNNGDIRLYGAIDVDGTLTGLGSPGQVLTSTGVGGVVQWTNKGTPTLNNANIFVGNASNNAVGVVMSGDASIDNLGELTIAANAVENEMLNKTAIPLSGFGAATATIDLGTNRIENLAVPSADADAATKKYVDDKTHAGTAAGSIFFADNAAAATPFAPIENNAQLFWDNANDKLYVGPQIATGTEVKLNVSGATRTQGIKNSLGSAGLPSYRFTDDVNSGMFLADPSGSELGFSTASTEAIRIDALQNVGIGETNPTSKLQTAGSFATATQVASGVTVLNEDDHTVIFNGAGSITLPTATTCPGRIYIIKNPSFVVGSDGYNNSLGIAETTIPSGTVVWLQSVGGSWEQVN